MRNALDGGLHSIAAAGIAHHAAAYCNGNFLNVYHLRQTCRAYEVGDGYGGGDTNANSRNAYCPGQVRYTDEGNDENAGGHDGTSAYTYHCSILQFE